VLRGKLFDWNGQFEDFFGTAVALSADGVRLVIGAHGLDGTVANQGGVFTYTYKAPAELTFDVKGGSSCVALSRFQISSFSILCATQAAGEPFKRWKQRGLPIKHSDPSIHRRYLGDSVAFNGAGTMLAVGLRWRRLSLEEEGGSEGGVYFFDWSGTEWVERGSVLTAADYAGSDYFGQSVAFNEAGTVLVVGAVRWEGTIADQGGVYTYDWNGSAWIQRGSVLTASDADTLDYFGSAVALSSNGDVLVVGAYFWDESTEDKGGVYTYDRSGNSWTQRGSVLTHSEPAQDDYFGRSVTLSGDGTVLSVGAPRLGLIYYDGGVFTYDRSGTSWVKRPQIVTGGGYLRYFSPSVAINADATAPVPLPEILTTGGIT
jgi:hypothetical protein